ncbi:hypothetical protein J31TS6_13780 [Brevibacillus reuszeri]|nr:hypothetical protein J31TS6_13780 [Brevibacillus reuszeri]
MKKGQPKKPSPHWDGFLAPFLLGLKKVSFAKTGGIALPDVFESETMYINLLQLCIIDHVTRVYRGFPFVELDSV